MGNGDTFGAMFGRLVTEKRGRHTTQGQLAAKVWPGDSNAENSRKGDISKLETGKVANPRQSTVERIADALGIDPGEIAELRRRAQMSPSEQLSNIPTLSRNDLELLAGRFEIPAPHDQDDAGLQEILTQKASEYRAYRKQIDALDDRVAGIANLKGAARDAAGRLDFDEVEALLSQVDEVETEIAAKTKETRAANALLRNRARQAHDILAAAADSFQSVDPLEPARKRIMHYFVLLYEHGLRYGGEGLVVAAELLRPALTDKLKQADASLWAAGQNNLGLALWSQGIRSGGEDGVRLLAEAVTAFRNALRVRTEDAHPVDWAMTQNNLDIALGDQGSRSGGKDGVRLLADAVTAYRNALRVYTEDAHPVDWATTQNNLGIALKNQGTRSGGEDGIRLLAEAVTAYRNALHVRTEDAHPADWATTQNNLGNTLGDQGTRSSGEDGIRLLAEAVTAYRNALRVYTEDAHPVEWAMTQNNLGIALKNQGKGSGGEDGGRLLADAVTAYRNAQRVYTEGAHPVDWAKTQENLAIAELAIADHAATGNPAPHLRRALDHVTAALRIYDPENMPYDYGTASSLCDRLKQRLADL